MTNSNAVKEGIVEINMSEYTLVNGCGFSEGLSTCIGLVAVRNDIALVGHFTAIGVSGGVINNDRQLFDEAIETLAEYELKDKLYLVGGGPYMHNGDDIVRADREYAISRTTESLGLPESDIKQFWLPKGRSLDFYVNTKNKENPFKCKIYDKL